MKVGIDTGGTFTDFVWQDHTGELHIHKVRSTPDDPSRAILSGIGTLDIPETTAVVHGSTVATNALLERRGAKTALITTQGFRDVLAIGRQNRPDIYALVPQKPPPLVPRELRFEVAERITAQGEVLRPLDVAQLSSLVAALRTAEVSSVAISLLFSYLDPGHEEQIAATLRAALPKLHLSLSSHILPEYREYERTSTTVINAYVAPLMSRYLARLDAEIGKRPLAIMQSNGGLISPHTAGAEAARTALSGPAGGVVGAHFVAAQAGFPEIITFDMGGTSTDVALCPGQLPTTNQGEIADLPLRLPQIDIHTVGAGGGSLATIDPGGALQVGPESAGADPGPACYPHVAGTAVGPLGATVTDANLLLGRLDADHFLGGTLRLDVAAAREALSRLADASGGSSPEEAAWGVLEVANAHMERAIRKISVERGFDPRQFTLVPFGGAGPLHACELAANLHIPRVLIPPTPGVLSALGMLVAAPTKDYSQTVLTTVGERAAGLQTWLAEAFGQLERRAEQEMRVEGQPVEKMALQRAIDMRYAGQSHELRLPLDWSGLRAATDGAVWLAERFHGLHEQRYGYRQVEADVELVTLRVTAVIPNQPPSLVERPPAQTALAQAQLGTKEVWFAQRPHVTPLFTRDRLESGHTLSGPALIFQYDTTIVLAPSWEGRVDRRGNLLLTRA